MKYYNPMNDVLFKFIFGKEERKHITIDFINSMLDRDKAHEIVDITFKNVEMTLSEENRRRNDTGREMAGILCQPIGRAGG